ncbi:MAG: 50S ribosomal protein L1 [Bdellovibrionales bacterium]|nr:50S ribosomal protein L1 [Bdellovibrionales bacterium]
MQRGRFYPLEEACELVASTASAKFDETVEISIRLGVDPTKADQNVRGSVALPHGLGKEIRVAVFAKGEKAQEAKDAGAELVGAEDLVTEVQNGNMNFDAVVATPDMMAHVGKIGKLLGPRGLMPSPKTGSVTFEVGEAVRGIKAGRAEYRVDKAGNVHAALGKASFGKDKIKDNASSLLLALSRAKPSSSKGDYFRSASISLTMGPGVPIDIVQIRNM